MGRFGTSASLPDKPNHKTSHKMKTYSPASNDAGLRELHNRLIELDGDVSILRETVRGGGYFAEKALEQLPEQEAELLSCRIAYGETPKHFDSIMEGWYFGNR